MNQIKNAKRVSLDYFLVAFFDMTNRRSLITLKREREKGEGRGKEMGVEEEPNEREKESE